jgi:hypothetical protein
MFEVLQTYFSPSTRIGGPAMRKSRDGAVVTPPQPYLTWLLALEVAVARRSMRKPWTGL